MILIFKILITTLICFFSINQSRKYVIDELYIINIKILNKLEYLR